jgi:putative colanic acid biosynthesis acetyltransferase WcaF
MSYSPSIPSYELYSLARRALWNTIYFTIFRPSPWFLFSWRNFLLSLFGARIGKGVRVYPSARIFDPLALQLNSFSSVGPRAFLYNHACITIGERSIISQDSFLCTGDHEFRSPNFLLMSKPITIGDDCWICAGCFVGPGVYIGNGGVLGARAVLFKDLPADQVWVGNPAGFARAGGRNSGHKSFC